MDGREADTLHEGNDTNGSPMSNWAIDGLIELIQKFYHKMNFKNDNLDGWMQHSPHLQLNNKSIRFARSEYTRVYSDAAKSAKFDDRSENDYDGCRNNRRASAVPKRLQEHLAIAEFCLLNRLAEEVPNRQYNQNSIWNSLGDITTPLTVETDEEKSSRWMDQVMSDEERALSNIADDIFSARKADGATSESNEINNVTSEMTLEFDEVGAGGDESNDTGEEVNVLGISDDEEVSDGNESEETESEIEVQIGRNGKGIKVRRAKVNELSLVDIFTVAMKALIALNLPVTRYRKKIRAEREQKFKKRLLDQIKSSHRQSGKNPIVEEAFAGLRLRKRSNT